MTFDVEKRNTLTNACLSFFILKQSIYTSIFLSVYIYVCVYPDIHIHYCLEQVKRQGEEQNRKEKKKTTFVFVKIENNRLI